RTPAGGGHLVNLAAANEAYPRAVRRDKWSAAALGSCKLTRRQLVEAAEEQVELAVDLPLIDDEASLRGSGDIRDVCDVRRRFDCEPHDRFRGVGTAGVPQE